MTRSKRLRPVADLAAQREKESSKTLADAHTRLVQQRSLLQKLERFHREYADSPAPPLANPVHLQDYRLFMNRLEDAILLQREQLARTQAEVDTQQAQWSERRSHRKALDNVTARYARAEIRAADQNEQLEIEEIAALLRLREK